MLLATLAASGTRFTIKYTAEVRGLFKLVMSLFAGIVKRQHKGDLHKVKELMEARALRLLRVIAPN